MNAPGYELPCTDLRLGFNRKNHGYLEFAFIVSSNGLEANLRISAFANGCVPKKKPASGNLSG